MTETIINKEAMKLVNYMEKYKEKRGKTQSELEPAKKDIINTISDAMITLNLDKPGHIEVTEDYISIHIPTDCVYITLSSLNEMIYTLQLDNEQVSLKSQLDNIVVTIFLDCYKEK